MPSCKASDPREEELTESGGQVEWGCLRKLASDRRLRWTPCGALVQSSARGGADLGGADFPSLHGNSRSGELGGEGQDVGGKVIYQSRRSECLFASCLPPKTGAKKLDEPLIRGCRAVMKKLGQLSIGMVSHAGQPALTMKIASRWWARGVAVAASKISHNIHGRLPYSVDHPIPVIVPQHGQYTAPYSCAARKVS